MQEISRQTYNLLALSAVRRLGAGILLSLLNKVDFSRDLIEIAEHLNAACQTLRLPSGIITASELKDAIDYAEQEAALAYDHEIAILSPLDASYPAALRFCPWTRPFLNIKGPIPKNSEKRITIVGGRADTYHGLTITRRIAHYLLERGYVLCSTLEEGISAQVHRDALDADAKSLVILPHGLGVSRPNESASLASAILASGGTIISTLSYNTLLKPRLEISALRTAGAISDGTVLIQAGFGDPVLSALQAALTSNRYVCAVKPTPKDARECTDAVEANLALLDRTQAQRFLMLDLHNQPELGQDYGQKVFAIASKDDYALLTGAGVKPGPLKAELSFLLDQSSDLDNAYFKRVHEKDKAREVPAED